MVYTAWSVVFGEQPSAAKWNLLGANDASFNDGTGIGNGAITSEHLNATIACRAYLNSAQTTNSNVATKVLLDAESYDLGNNYDTTNKRFVAPLTGYYQVNANGRFDNLAAGSVCLVYIYVNGAEYSQARTYGSGTNDDPQSMVSDVVPVTAGQYIEMYMLQNSASPESIANDSKITYMSIHYIGA